MLPHPIGRSRRRAIFASLLLATSCATARGAEQSAQDPDDVARLRHTSEISALIFEYARATDGRLPFQERALGQPYRVAIGSTVESENEAARLPAIRGTGRWGNANELESELSRVLQRAITLPRDPQPTRSVAPNVYIYFVRGNDFCAVAHLSGPSRLSRATQWEGGTFHSHALCERPSATIRR